jgi:hypothetical protein
VLKRTEGVVAPEAGEDVFERRNGQRSLVYKQADLKVRLYESVVTQCALRID